MSAALEGWVEHNCEGEQYDRPNDIKCREWIHALYAFYDIKSRDPKAE